MSGKLFDLSGRTAVVTGGEGYLGSAMAEALARAGSCVYLASILDDACRKVAERIRAETGSSAYGIYLDISSMDSIKTAFNTIYGESGRIDILVNNACYTATGKIEHISEEDWQKGIDGTINGVFRCTQAVLPFMETGGTIINIASMYGLVSPDPSIYGDSGFDNPPNYGAGKAAIIQFTRFAACHLGKKGIRVNAIAPGPFPNEKVQQNTQFIENLKRKNPLGRIGYPDDIKGAVVFFASDASSFITGAVLPVDGGWTAW